MKYNNILNVVSDFRYDISYVKFYDIKMVWVGLLVEGFFCLIVIMDVLKFFL